MPVKVWELGSRGLESQVRTGWDVLWTAEEHREEAEELDQRLDALLDAAIATAGNLDNPLATEEFLRAWAIGRTLTDSKVASSPALVNERPELLWLALARKCRTGARHDGRIESRWVSLRPKAAKEPRREGGKLDYFEMCRWLAEQELLDAAETFGGQVRNVWQMLERPSLRPRVFRQAFLAWLRSLTENLRFKLYDQDTFAEMMKTLRRRWPDRGPGSAKRPVHYSSRPDGLQHEIEKVLSLWAADKAPATGQ
jgi:hypothetical protein